MAKKVDSMDKINDTTLHELLMMMDARLKHIEDISADNRAIIVKLVKQSNQIVDFLKNVEMDMCDIDYDVEGQPSIGVTLPEDKIHMTIQKFGNTSAASIPIGIENARLEGKIKPGDISILGVVGAGLTWGAGVIKW